MSCLNVTDMLLFLLLAIESQPILVFFLSLSLSLSLLLHGPDTFAETLCRKSLKGTVILVWVWIEEYDWKDQTKEKDCWGFLKFSTSPPIFYKYKQECGISVKSEGNCHVIANNYWSILPCLLLADSLISQIPHHTQPIGAFIQLGTVLSGHFLVALLYPLRISQRPSNNLWAFPRGFPILLSSAQQLSNRL